MPRATITFVTGNVRKLEEFFEILGSNFKHQVSNRKISLPEYQGKMSEISFKKCKAAAGIIQGPVLTEDTSLCFDALGGMPGPYIKSFTESKVGPDGLCKMLAGFENKRALAVSNLAYTSGRPGDPVLMFQGKVPGTIVSPRGSRDFDWDSCFQPDEMDETYAELPKEVKNSISHRFRALEKLKEYLSKVPDQ